MRSALAAIALLWIAASQCVHALQGSLQVVTFIGPVTGQPVTFTLYLPPGYNGATNRYPVIIHLHGIGGRHSGPHTNTVTSSHETAVASGIIEPCIIAFPDGYTNSFWADSSNSLKPAETNLRLEVIPYLDANYRTIGTPKRRVIQGYSMGGFGAAKFATKFPELFAACVIYDGAMLTWAEIQQRHPTEAAEIFDSSSAVFDLYSPWRWLTQNVESVRASIPFRDMLGALTNENRSWRDALLAQSIQPSYVETGCPHQLPCLLDTEGSNSWAFISSAFARSDPTNELRVQVFRKGSDILLQWNSAPAQLFEVQRRVALASNSAWASLVTNWPATASNSTAYQHTNALAFGGGFYRVARVDGTGAPPAFVFNWTGTNFTYSDSQRTFTGVMLKPAGDGPFPSVVISHGAGGSASGYSLPKARDMVSWGMVALAPTLTHVSGGETNAVNMGFCPENLARVTACVNVLGSLSYVDTNRLALFGHSMGAFATIGSAAQLVGRIRAGAISSGGAIPDAAGNTNAAPTVSEASAARAPFLTVHCDADPVVPPARSLLWHQILNSNGVTNLRVLISSNSIANPANWHNIHNDANANTLLLTNTRAWFQEHGVIP